MGVTYITNLKFGTQTSWESFQTIQNFLNFRIANLTVTKVM